MMKRTIKGQVKQVLKTIMENCKECGRYYSKDSFCPTCLMAEESLEKHQKSALESRS